MCRPTRETDLVKKMRIFWIILGGTSVLLYITLDLAVTFYRVKRISNEEKVVLPGKKKYYVAASTILAFTIISAFYFAALNYVEGPYQFVCWPLLSVILSFSAGKIMSVRLKRASLE